MHLVELAFAENADPAKRVQRFEGVRHAQLGMLFPVKQLEILHGILNIDDSARAVLHIHRAGLYQFPHLALPQMQENRPPAVIHPDDGKRAVALWNQAIRTGDPYVVEYRLRRKDGTYR